MNERLAVMWMPVARLWRDTRGDAGPIGLILATVIVAIGVIVGLVSVRDAIVQEFGDVAVSLDALNQSYYAITNVDTNGNTLDGYEYSWSVSYQDGTGVNPSSLDDPAGAAPACLNLSLGAVSEGNPLASPPGTVP